jgi:oligo-1,6-glucosidase
MADSNSIFHYYRQLIQLRKTNPVMVYGSYDLILPEHEQIYAFTRTLEEERLLILLNFSQEPVVFDLPDDFASTNASLLIGNYPVDPAADIRSINLRPYEARVYRVYSHSQ